MNHPNRSSKKIQVIDKKDPNIGVISKLDKIAYAVYIPQIVDRKRVKSNGDKALSELARKRKILMAIKAKK